MIAALEPACKAIVGGLMSVQSRQVSESLPALIGIFAGSSEAGPKTVWASSPRYPRLGGLPKLALKQAGKVARGGLRLLLSMLYSLCK